MLFKKGHKLQSGKKHSNYIDGRYYDIGKKEYGKKWYREHREELIERSKKYNLEHKEELKEYRKKYEQENKEKIRIWKREYGRKRNKNNPKHRLDRNMATIICEALKGKKADRRWESLVGYTLQDLMTHLENIFDENMSWENHGYYWHIDHKRPKSWFKYENAEDEEFKKCWALENLQPLEARENMVKGNRYESL